MVKNSFSLNKNKNYAGFTLIECLLALFLLSIICLLFSAVIKNAKVVSEVLKSEKEKEWHIFVIQLENELAGCQFKEIQGNKMIYENPKKERNILIEYKLGKIIKVDNGGYQPLLIDVREVDFKKEDDFVVIRAVFKNEQQYSARWSIIKGNEEEV
ncbi:competence type IV pilus minor pilin ComGF [Enterococcus wangshanyuanii]|uniref:Competence protein ComG n=1 Tax=Enterococcus wangshanyuanii TaxID=2005703 RepID=A0ABQ1P188_9ENTE|nr:competence type IV pilus minor pilin ComGF [Enterococcus wangshanyuanii]GGC87054.1 competence protein ComG [Enterococcus wangshanyuanii]